VQHRTVDIRSPQWISDLAVYDLYDTSGCDPLVRWHGGYHLRKSKKAGTMNRPFKPEPYRVFPWTTPYTSVMMRDESFAMQLLTARAKPSGDLSLMVSEE